MAQLKVTRSCPGQHGLDTFSAMPFRRARQFGARFPGPETPDLLRTVGWQPPDWPSPAPRIGAPKACWTRGHDMITITDSRLTSAPAPPHAAAPGGSAVKALSSLPRL